MYLSAEKKSRLNEWYCFFVESFARLLYHFLQLMKKYLFLLFIFLIRAAARDYPVPLGPDYPPAPVPFYPPEPEPLPGGAIICNCSGEIAELRRRIEILEAEIERLQAQLTQKPKADRTKNHPCPPESLKRVENAFFNYNYDHKTGLKPDGSETPFKILADNGYLKEIPTFFRLVRFNSEQKAYCQKDPDK